MKGIPSLGKLGTEVYKRGCRALNYEEAFAAVTGPGQLFEITEGNILGHHMKYFAHTPPSLGDLFGRCRDFGDKEAVVYGSERMTYGTLMDQADRIAHLLSTDLGVEKGDRVAIAMRNLPEWISTYIAVHLIGGVATLINAWWQPNEIAYSLDDSTPKVIVCDKDRAMRTVDSATERGVKVVVVRDYDREVHGEGVIHFDPNDTSLPTDYVRPPMDHDDDATILYTSGTTGFPKGAVSSQRGVLTAVFANGARASIAMLRNPEANTPKFPTAFILAIPLFHVTGSVAVMLSALVSGAKIVLMHRWDPTEAARIIEEERITRFVGVPTMSIDLLENEEFLRRDTSSLTHIGGGGSAVPPELIRKIASTPGKGSPGFGYGMTETNSYGPQIEGEEAVARPTSAGKPLPILEVAIFNEYGERQGPNVRGEICFSGPNIIKGYWNNEAATKASFFGSFLRSGDIGYLDEDGYTYIEDRIKDMVIRGGENVYCAEVEAAIYECEGVHEAAVFGLPDPRLGEEVAAVVYKVAGSDLSAASLEAQLTAKIAKFKVPTKIFIVDEQLPRGATGKILKRDLKELYAKANS